MLTVGASAKALEGGDDGVGEGGCGELMLSLGDCRAGAVDTDSGTIEVYIVKAARK